MAMLDLGDLNVLCAEALECTMGCAAQIQTATNTYFEDGMSIGLSHARLYLLTQTLLRLYFAVVVGARGPRL